jgi:hypothetical protein
MPGSKAVDPELLNPDTDPDPAFQVNPDTDTDLDPIRIQGFETEEKKYGRNFVKSFFDQKLHFYRRICTVKSPNFVTFFAHNNFYFRKTLG